VVEYAPKKVKQTITSNGNASKEQVAGMLEQLLKIEFPGNLPEDATDALSVALCHHYLKGQNKRQSKSWKAFVNSNPGRIV
jgi:crossover junction endodeoxyribonuclease RuvC